MASCHKCGKHDIPKRKDGLRWCKHCGAMPGIARCARSGYPDIALSDAPKESPVSP